MKKISYLIIIILSTIVFHSCIPSLVYSPSLNLPSKPLIKDEVQILAGVGYLPETRPERTDPKMVPGGEASIRFGLSNIVSAQIKGWKDISGSFSDARYGFSISSIVVLGQSSDFVFGTFPSAAIVLEESNIEGGGGSLPICFWYTKFYPLSFYSAFGPALGIRDISKKNNEWGWALILNVGAATTIKEHFTINFEVAGIKQVNEQNGYKSYFFSPSLNIGYVF
jgi:hypothetical protein